MAETISREALRDRMERGERFILMETLPPYHYESGHLPGAINLPPNQVAELSSVMLPDKSAEIVVYCANPH